MSVHSTRTLEKEGRVNLLNSKVEREERGFRFQVKSSLVALVRWLWIKFLCQLEDLNSDPAACVCNSVPTARQEDTVQAP